MTSEDSRIPFVQSVLFTTDFGEASEQAFVHALAIALIRQTRFSILHAGEPIGGDWSKFPAVRGTLERWGLLEPGSPKSAVLEQLSMRVTKINAQGDPVGATLDEVEKKAPDLVVLGTEGREGLARFLRPSVGMEIGRKSSSRGAMTLLVPAAASGFVRAEDGRLSLRRVLVPVDHTPDASEAVVRATRAAQALGDGDVEITLLHVGQKFPALEIPPDEAYSCTYTTRTGDVVKEILEAAEDTDLIVMATDGRDGILDALRGSFTERVVREAGCAVLAVPST